MDNPNTDEAIASLSESFAKYSVQDYVRSSNRLSMPDAKLVSEFELLALRITKWNRGWSTQKKELEVITNFGVPAVVIAKVWEMIQEEETSPNLKMKKKHYMWGLYFLKVYVDMNKMGSCVVEAGDNRPDEKTVYKWIWVAIEAISELEDIVIKWENRFTNDDLGDCLAGIDTVDCLFQQMLYDHPLKPGKKKRNKCFMAVKYNRPGLRYQVCSALRSSDIVHISGPYLPGDNNDLTIFRQELKWMLPAGERVEADDIYASEAPEFIKCTKSTETIGNEESEGMRKRAQARIEVLMGHFKKWTCLNQPYKGHGSPAERLEKHRKMFFACGVLNQVAMEMGYCELWKLGDKYDSCK
jgi:hypothetical protein